MLIFLPPFAAPDEPAHFYRAYQISKLNLTSHTTNEGALGGIVLKIPPNKLFSNWKLTNDEFVSFPNTAVYSPAGYLPQSTGIGLARTAKLPVGYMVLLGRFFNLLTYILLVFIAIRLVPFGKWVYCVIGLFPVAIQQAASLSIDGITIGLCFILIALLQKLFYQKNKITNQEIAWLLLLASGIALTKPNGLVLLIPLIFLPKSLFINIKQKISIIGGAILAAVTSYFMWSEVIKLKHYNTNSSQTIGLLNVNPSDQLSFILKSPIVFFKVLFKSFIFQGTGGDAKPDFYLTSMYGYFSNFLYKLPLSLLIMGYVLLFIVLITKEKDEKINTSYLLSQTSTFLLAILGVAVALYLVWTPVGAPQIEGIQGRYFIPFLPLLIPLGIYAKRWINISTKSPLVLGCIVTFIASCNLLAMIILTSRWFH